MPLSKARLATATGTLVCALGFVACDRVDRQDTAPTDIRGQPITAGSTTPGTSGAVAIVSAPSTNTAEPTVRNPEASIVRARIALGVDGFVHLGFETLAGFDYQAHQEPLPTNAPPPPTRVPEFVRVYDRQPVAIKGYMLPMKLQNGLATELLLMRDQSMCCFGVVPKINEWVNVKMTGRGVKPVQDQPVTIFGRLEVGEIWDNGYLVTIYNLAGERMETPFDL